jgi:hypothetical protein
MMAVTFSYAGSRQVRRDAFYVENEPLTKEDRFSKASQNIKHSPQKIRNTATPMYFKVSGVAFALRQAWPTIRNA